MSMPAARRAASRAIVWGSIAICAGMIGIGATVRTVASVDRHPIFTDVSASAGIRFRHNSGAFGRIRAYASALT